VTRLPPDHQGERIHIVALELGLPAALVFNLETTIFEKCIIDDGDHLGIDGRRLEGKSARKDSHLALPDGNLRPSRRHQNLVSPLNPALEGCQRRTWK
jgi:hypothetical protein